MPDPRIGRVPLTALLVALVAGGCATSPKEAADRAECKAYARPFEHAGRISAYVVFWVSAIHAGPGSLLVTEAGGTVSDIDGRPWTIRSDSLLASATPGLHEELLDLARAARPRRPRA